MAWSVYLLVMLVGLIRGQYYDDYEYDYDLYDDDYGNNNGLEDIYAGMEATILTKGEVIQAYEKLRRNLDLQCEYRSPAPFPIIWSKIDKANTVIAVDNMVVGQDYKGRGEVTMDRSTMTSVLTLYNLTIEDDGGYKCTVAAPNAPELIHTIKIETPPVIESILPSSPVVEVIKGKDLTLTCKASGFPTPSISWNTPDRALYDGSNKIDLETFTFQNVSEKHSGSYMCIANNDEGTDIREVEVVVNEVPVPENVEGLFFGPAGGRFTAEKRFRVGLNFELTMKIKPRSADGILVAVTGRRDYLLLQMVNGSVHFVVDNGRGPITTVFKPNHPKELLDGQWHRIIAVKSRNVVILSVNKIFAKPGIGLDDSTDTNNPLIFGFHPRPKREKAKTGDNYSGCMKDVVIDGQPLEITDEKILGGHPDKYLPFFLTL